MFSEIGISDETYFYTLIGLGVLKSWTASIKELLWVLILAHSSVWNYSVLSNFNVVELASHISDEI